MTPIRWGTCPTSVHKCASKTSKLRDISWICSERTTRSRSVISIDKLYIKIELMQTDLVPETLERVAQEMKMFEKYCKELKKKTPTTRVQYYFVRIGRVRNYIDWHGNVHPAGDWDFN